MDRKVLAVDLGASGGRVMLGSLLDGTIHLKELHRFSNDPVTVRGTMYWDIYRLLFEIRRGIAKAAGEGTIESISVDTWGVDYGLLGADGQMIDMPVHYRDSRTNGVPEKVYQMISPEELYQRTGNQLMAINTAFQLSAHKERRPQSLDQAEWLLMIPALFSYFLGSDPVCDISAASTTQLFDPDRRCWAVDVIKQLGFSEKMFPEIVESGTVIGALADDSTEHSPLIIAGCGHDTQCAEAAVPAEENEFLFISCGTWSLMGTELEQPLISEESFRLDLTNEAAYGGKASFLKNITGLWLIQESRRQWIREGMEYSFGELEQMAGVCESQHCYIDPDDPVFLPEGDIPGRIRTYCKKTGQAVPESIGQVVRCIDESLAKRYFQTKEEIEACTGKRFDRIYLVGGGAQSALLCQLTADICGCDVTAGPVEATALGNTAIQLITLGAFSSLQDARRAIRASQDIKVYHPRGLS
ncbi:MAG: rhamnulokinase [Eubacterium sp.]|nr:rhamnulokinase [Eubacterium sp.]